MAIKLMIFKVLVVDNMMVDRNLYQLYVETNFKNVKAAYTLCSSSAEALRSIDDYAYDLALVDASLMSRSYDKKGSEIIEAIRRSEKNAHIAIIGFSSNANYGEPMMEAGADAFIYKASTDPTPSVQFTEKAPEAMLKAAERNPKAYLLLLHNMGIISVPELEDGA